MRAGQCRRGQRRVQVRVAAVPCSCSNHGCGAASRRESAYAERPGPIVPSAVNAGPKRRAATVIGPSPAVTRTIPGASVSDTLLVAPGASAIVASNETQAGAGGAPPPVVAASPGAVPPAGARDGPGLSTIARSSISSRSAVVRAADWVWASPEIESAGVPSATLAAKYEPAVIATNG